MHTALEGVDAEPSLMLGEDSHIGYVDDVPEVLREIVKSKMDANYGKKWKDELKKERFLSRLNPGQQQMLFSGNVEEWDMTLLTHTLLYSSQFLLAECLPVTIGSIRDELIPSSQVTICQGDIILCDHSANFKHHRVQSIVPSIKLERQVGRGFKRAYKVNDDYTAVDKLRIVRNENFAHTKCARIDDGSLQNIVKTIKKSYEALKFSQDRVDKIMAESYCGEEQLQEYVKKWTNETRVYLQTIVDVDSNVAELRERVDRGVGNLENVIQSEGEKIRTEIQSEVGHIQENIQTDVTKKIDELIETKEDIKEVVLEKGSESQRGFIDLRNKLEDLKAAAEGHSTDSQVRQKAISEQISGIKERDSRKPLKVDVRIAITEDGIVDCKSYEKETALSQRDAASQSNSAEASKLPEASNTKQKFQKGKDRAVKDNFEKIKHKFATLVAKVSSVLDNKNIKMREFRLYIMTRFPPGIFVEGNTVTDIFAAISDNRLWDYDNYTPVEDICYLYGDGDEELLGKIEDYKSDLAGFQATTKIVDYIKNCNSDEIAYSDEEKSQYKARYDKKYCQELTIKLEIPVSQKCLNYIDELWRSICDVFLLPSLPALLESIHEGCTEVTWYIFTQTASQLESVVLQKRSVKLFQQYCVIQIALEGRILYNQRKIQTVLTEKEIESLKESLKEKKIVLERMFKIKEHAHNVQHKAKDNYIQKLQEQTDLLEHKLEEIKYQVNIKDKIIKKLSVAAGRCHVFESECDLMNLKRQLVNLTRQLTLKDKCIERLQAELDQRYRREWRLFNDLEQEVQMGGMSRKKLMMFKEDEKTLEFTWKCAPEMPFEMTDFIQSVLVQKKVYVGGGRVDVNCHDMSYVVMEYDIDSEKWDMLPSYQKCEFAMGVISHHLVLIGGSDEESSVSKQLGVWRGDLKEWTHCYPEMSTARSGSSALSYSDQLIVAGGCDENYDPLCSIEILNTETKQWSTAPSMPVPLVDMKTALVKDVWYFMGDYEEGQLSNKVFSISIQDLLLQIDTNGLSCGGFKELTTLPNRGSAPLSLGGSLFAVGGLDDNNETVASIYHYQTHTKEWVKVGNLPSPIYSCTCIMISDKELMVAGGQKDPHELHLQQKRVDIAQVL